MKSLHVLGICGSLRRQSTNLGLLRYAKEHAPSGMVIEQRFPAIANTQ